MGFKQAFLASSVLATLVSAQSQLWGQCGGMQWTGPTTCVSGSTCTFSNPWYSQCLPGSAAPSPSTTTTTQRQTTTSQRPTTTSIIPTTSLTVTTLYTTSVEATTSSFTTSVRPSSTTTASSTPTQAPARRRFYGQLITMEHSQHSLSPSQDLLTASFLLRSKQHAVHNLVG